MWGGGILAKGTTHSAASPHPERRSPVGRERAPTGRDPQRRETLACARRAPGCMHARRRRVEAGARKKRHGARRGTRASATRALWQQTPRAGRAAQEQGQHLCAARGRPLKAHACAPPKRQEKKRARASSGQRERASVRASQGRVADVLPREGAHQAACRRACRLRDPAGRGLQRASAHLFCMTRWRWQGRSCAAGG